MPFFVKGEKIVLKKDGTWVADGTEITHDQTRDLFFRSIHFDTEQGQYYLEVGYERIFIEVEDTPYFVTSVDRSTARAALSDFTDRMIAAEYMKYENGVLYLELPERGQRARFLSAAYYELLKGLEEDDGFYFVTIAGKRANLEAKVTVTRGRL